MNYFLTYLIVFAVGGLVCLIGQVIINLTKFTSARILVTFLLLGVLLETIGVFKYIKILLKRVLPFRLSDSAAIWRKELLKALSKTALSELW